MCIRDSLKKGAKDGQSPHGLDEVYYVVSGKGRLAAGDADYAAVPGSVLYVAAGEEHRFHTIEEDLTLLVFFSTAPVPPRKPQAPEPAQPEKD